MTSRSAADRRRCQRPFQLSDRKGLSGRKSPPRWRAPPTAVPAMSATSIVRSPTSWGVARRASGWSSYSIGSGLMPESTNRADPRARSHLQASGRRVASGVRHSADRADRGLDGVVDRGHDALDDGLLLRILIRFVGHRHHLRPAIGFAVRRRARPSLRRLRPRHAGAALAISPDLGPSASAMRKNSVSTSTIDAPDARLR